MNMYPDILLYYMLKIGLTTLILPDIQNVAVLKPFFNVIVTS